MSTAAHLQNKADKSQSPSSLTHAGLLLQRKCACGSPTKSLTGECADCKSKKRLQAKLAIGASNDPLEQEAERVAEQMMSAPKTQTISPMSSRIKRFPEQTAGQESSKVDRKSVV